MKCYSDLIKIDSFKGRVEYLSLKGLEYDIPRAISNRFYKSKLWLDVRADIIARDLGCDLGFPLQTINTKVIVHHVDPLTVEDIINLSPKCFDPENLITVSIDTHNIIHYGSPDDIYEERRPGDTKLW